MDKNSFMFAVLNNPSLTQKERERVISLITRDIEQDLMAQTQRLIREEIKQKSGAKEDKSNGDHARQEAWIHDPRKVCDFLNKFTSDPILRNVFHSWDPSAVKDYDDFIFKIKECLTKDKTFRDLYHYNIGLNYTLREFILNNGKKEFSIPKEDIRIGLQYPPDVIKAWMGNNKKNKLAEMPMSAFPVEYRPKGTYGGREIANMNGLIEYVKHIIEFRDFDFEAMIYDQFTNPDFTPSIDGSVQGISFYAYTSMVKGFLVTVLDNIRRRILNGAPNKVSVFTKELGKNTFELHILHEGSFADKDINDGKLLYSGDVASWRLWQGGQYNSLVSVCDYAVQSRFYSDDGSHSLKPYRIDYLYPGIHGNSSDDIPEPRKSLMEEDAKGFEYIMTFYK